MRIPSYLQSRQVTQQSAGAPVDATGSAKTPKDGERTISYNPNSATSIAKALLGGIKDFASVVANKPRKVAFIDKGVTAFSEGVKNIGNKIKDGFQDIASKIGEVAGKASDKIGEQFGKIKEGISDGASKMISEIKDDAKIIRDGIKNGNIDLIKEEIEINRGWKSLYPNPESAKAKINEDLESLKELSEKDFAEKKAELLRMIENSGKQNYIDVSEIGKFINEIENQQIASSVRPPTQPPKDVLAAQKKKGLPKPPLPPRNAPLPASKIVEKQIQQAPNQSIPKSPEIGDEIRGLQNAAQTPGSQIDKLLKSVKDKPDGAVKNDALNFEQNWDD